MEVKMKIRNIMSIFLVLIVSISFVIAPSIQAQNVKAISFPTIKDGDPYFCENPSDPDWTWDLDQLGEGLLAVENEFVKDDSSNDPPGSGEAYILPKNYAKISFDEETEYGSALVSIRDKRDHILDNAEVYPSQSLVEAGISNMIRLDRGSSLALGEDSPSIENAKTSNEPDYEDNLFMEVLKGKIKSVSFIENSGGNMYEAKVLGDNLRFRINDDNTITLFKFVPDCN